MDKYIINSSKATTENIESNICIFFRTILYIMSLFQAMVDNNEQAAVRCTLH